MISFDTLRKLNIKYPNDQKFAEVVRKMIWEKEDKLLSECEFEDTYIFERNPDTGEVFRRKFGNYDKRELIEKKK